VPSRTPSPDQVRAALEELLGWPEIVRSPQLSKFLKHIVEAKLRGEEASIKAYSIAVDVLGRPPTFDPQTDPIVRVQARRLRGLLHEFYRQKLGRSAARITLPVGRYVPEFEAVVSGEGVLATADDTELAIAPPAALAAVTAPGPRFGRRFWLQGLAALSLIVVLGAILVGLQALRTVPPPPVGLPGEPTVLISNFANVTGNGSLDGFALRLSEQLGSLLAQFEDMQVGYAEQGRASDQAENAYVLSGTLRGADSGVEIAAILTDATDGSVVWSLSVDQPLPPANEDGVVASVARKIVREIGPFRGPLHARARRWMDAQNGPLPGVSSYVCLLKYRYARESGASNKIAEALACNERLLLEHPNLPLPLAAEAWLEGNVILGDARPTDDLEQLMSKPEALAESARRLAPESSFAHEQLAVLQNWQGKAGAAQQNFAIALGFQALNTDARAAYAISLARSGDWDLAEQQAQFAVADSAYPAPWYHYPLALQALRDGRLEQAIADGKIAANSGTREIGAIITLAAAGLAGRTSEIAEYRPLVVSMERLRRDGIIPWLTIRIKEQRLLDVVANGLRAAGIPESALTAAF
jgi:TolB-like protein